MKKKRIWILILGLIIIVGVIIWFKFDDITKNESMPKITLTGNKIITINLGDTYKEEGYQAYDEKDGNITSKVKVTKNTNYNKAGTYQITYKVKNSDGTIAIAQRFVKVVEKPYYKDSYDKLDNKMRGWWSDNKKDHNRPAGGADINELKKYGAYFMGPNEKVLYLTFDEGGNETYVKEIVKVLNDNDVKGTFFLCKHYMVSNKDLVKRMAEDGHSIGNHTANHYSMPSLATKENYSKYLAEIQSMEKAYYEITGKEMDKVYRDPRGEWSYRDLQMVKDLGYKTFFYSADYLDWNGDVTKEYALNELMKRYHNGAIYLLHPKNKGNYEALDTFIKEMKKLGYRFDLVKNIPS